jgi:thioesterase domain-containing protein/acyl carrier protein
LNESQGVVDSPRLGNTQLIVNGIPSGLLPQQGIRALMQILQAETPRSVVVSSHFIEKVAKQSVAAKPRLVNDTSADALGIEATLTQWFQDLLGLERVEADDDFFSLGGHSLIGVRLFAKIKNVYQVDLELATLFQARTVRLLADKIRNAQQPVPASEPKKWSYLVPIQPKGSRVPLFLIHAVGGEVLFYEPLAKALGSGQPLYAIQSYLANRKEIKEVSIEEMASAYLREIQEFYPQGPYLIGGHSFGGLVAFEMARQLHAQGQGPALLVLLDSVVPGSRHSIKPSDQISMLFDNLRSEGMQYLMTKINTRKDQFLQNLRHRLQITCCSALRYFGRPLPQVLRYALIEEVHRRALHRYVFLPYGGIGTLIRANEGKVFSLSEREDEVLGWGNLVKGGLNAYEIPGDHNNMLRDPQVQSVAKSFGIILSGLDSKDSRTLSAM